LLDTNYRAEIPGGIELEAQLVGPIPRFLAFIVDFAIRGLILFILFMVMVPFGRAGAGFWYITLFLIEWFYPVVFEVFRRGQTPGKKMLGISVVHDDLTPITFGTSMLRNLLRSVDFLPFLYVLGLITMVSNGRFQRLGDLAAGTLVISVKESKVPTMNYDLRPLAPPTVLLRNEQTAIVDFLQRSKQLSVPRQLELAGILDGITHNKDDDKVTQLHRIGAWFLGVK
jgi:uncharacterized RDD family membrane protein YckC